MKIQVVVICGSKSDFIFAKSKIVDPLQEKGINTELFAASAHKEPEKVIQILKDFEKEAGIVFITIAGRSNALSGFVAANSPHVTIACPPFKSLEEYMIDIHSTLRMPSKTPVLTVVDPENCVLAVERILGNRIKR